jgi:hypothetical protein
MAVPFRPQAHLTRLQLLLRLAAGQSVWHIAILFGIAVARLERRALPMMAEAMVMGALRRLAPDSRFNRLARLAHLRLHEAMRAGVAGAREFFRWSWSWNEDPAQRIAALAEARLARIDRVSEGPPSPPTAQPRSRPSASPRERLGHAALRFALSLRDAIIVEEGEALCRGERPEPAPGAPDRIPAHVPQPPFWVTDFSLPPQPEKLWAALRLPGHAAPPPPQGIPPHGRALYLPYWQPPPAAAQAS